MMVCKRVIYTGRVQGVGFRYTALGLSRDYAIAGTVRNCTDGSVELVVQGEDVQVDAFLTALAQQMEGYIAEQKIHDVPPTTARGFQITT